MPMDWLLIHLVVVTRWIRVRPIQIWVVQQKINVSLVDLESTAVYLWIPLQAPIYHHLAKMILPDDPSGIHLYPRNESLFEPRIHSGPADIHSIRGICSHISRFLLLQNVLVLTLRHEWGTVQPV
jgi:hypothetical protein